MAQERIKWELIKPILNVKVDNTIEAGYNLADLYEDFVTMTEVQQMVIVYGVKQNLSDKIANMGSYTLKEKIGVMDNRWDSLVAGIWKTPTKEKVTLKKKAAELRAEGNLSDDNLALLTRLGL